MKDMQDDYYFLDEENYKIVGKSFGKEYQLGAQVQVRVKNIDLSKKRIDFELIDE